MATLIDFTPAALEIDEIAAASVYATPNIPAPSFPTAPTSASPHSDASYGNNFINNAPDILFVSEYAEENAAAKGCLVVFEQYYNATHYEIFRRDYLAQDDSWKRVLLIDANRLKTETDTFRPYIQNRLKINIAGGYYAILDLDAAKPDKITEYKVAASFYPTSAKIDYARCLFSKGKLTGYNLSTSNANLFSFAESVLGNSDYAWIIAMINPGFNLFDKTHAVDPLRTRFGNVAYAPTNIDSITKIIQESIYFFGLKATLANIVTVISNNEMAKPFFNDFIASIDETKKLVSYQTFQTLLKPHYPNYTGKTIEGFVVPQYDDTTSFNNIISLTIMFSRLTTFYLAALYGYYPFTSASLPTTASTYIPPGQRFAPGKYRVII